jgi:hypothetical protein
MSFLRPPGVGTMAEAVEGRTGTPAHRELRPGAGDGAGAPAGDAPSRTGPGL